MPTDCPSPAIALLTLGVFLVGGCAPYRCPPVTLVAIDEPRDDGLASTLRPYLASLERAGIAGVVGVAQGDAVLVRAGFGNADHKCGLRNDPALAYDIGSIAKTFTAAAVYVLAEAGKLELDDPIVEHLAGVPPDKAGITIRQLVTHTSGLANYHAPGDFTPMGRARAVRRSLSLPLTYPPGTSSAYSNAGYALLAAIIERASGRAFQSYVVERVVDPLALRHTGWYGDRAMRTARGRANGRDRGRPSEYRLTWALLGGGGMVSTVDDMLRWTRGLFGGSLLPARVVDQMLEAPDGHWASGWEVSRGAHGIVVQKGGSGSLGFTSQVRHYPERDVTIALLLNAYAPPHEGNIHNVVGAELERRVLAQVVQP